MENSAPPVIIIGAGPSGLAASACLAPRGVDSIVLERDECVGSLGQKRAYDRLPLHLPKQASALPHLPHADDAPTYLPRDHFVRYLDAYADRFAVHARLRLRREWEVEVVHLCTGDAERLAVFACRVVFGNTARPDVGSFTRKIQSNVYPVIDVGSYNKIKSDQTQVLPAMTSIEGDAMEFAGGERERFDTIVFATGYRSTAKKWLKSDDGRLIGDDGMASGRSPKGENGLYRVGEGSTAAARTSSLQRI
uniref:indole-3-pyruvate monooxygenase n=1 Tax=Aegilops tauschii TaxID=37682 RepID=M8BWR2_AEGTA